MPGIKKISIRIFFIFIILIPVAAYAHYIIFPQETESILIDYSGFKKDGRLYFNSNVSAKNIDSKKNMIAQASLRIAAFWGKKTCNPKIIYCGTEEDFRKYSAAPAAPAVTYFKFCSYIVLSNDGADQDVIAHEMCHTEFFQRIGFYNRQTKIPDWFDEGLAMQTDYRINFSEDSLKLKSNDYKNLPDITHFKKGQFNQGSLEQVMLNYMMARHEVKNWYTKEKLEQLIKDLNAGKSFEEAYKH